RRGAVDPAGGDVLALRHDLGQVAVQRLPFDPHAQVGIRPNAATALDPWPTLPWRHHNPPRWRRPCRRVGTSMARSHSRAGTSTRATVTRTESPNENRRRVRRPTR